MPHDSFLFQALIYLIAAVVSVPIAKRLGLGSVLGYLISGVVIGPFVLGLIGEDHDRVMHFAEFGVVMMLFIIGLELKPSRLWTLRGPILGLGGMQVMLTSMAGAIIAKLLGLPLSQAVAVGLIFAMSSTAIVLQSLEEKGWLKAPGGQSAFSVLLFQDIAVIPMLALLPLLATSQLISPQAVAETHSSGLHLVGWQQALLVIGVITAIIVTGQFLIRPVFRFIAESRLREMFTATALLIVIGIAVLMQSIGLSPALGTFLAGVVLADSEYRHELESDIEPFKGLLMGLFFISVGASIDFNLLFLKMGMILGIASALIGVKLIILLALGRFSKMRTGDNLLFAFSLSQGGEFGFVLFAFATQNRVLPADLANACILAIAISMLMTPFLLMAYEAISRLFLTKPDGTREPDKIDTTDNPVIIAGFGRFGQIIGRLLKANKIGTTVLDLDANQIEVLRHFGMKVFYGDVTRIDLLRAAGAEKAKLMIIAIDEPETSIELIKSVKSKFPHLKLLARAQDRAHAFELMRLGVQVVRREMFDSSLDLGVQALQLLGFRSYQALRAARTFKHHDEKMLQELLDISGDEKQYIAEARQRSRDVERLIQADHDDIELEQDKGWEAAPSQEKEE
jgi:glutathione-regulated potassium-efflux system protein KefB